MRQAAILIFCVVAPTAALADAPPRACLLRGANVSLPIEVRPDDGPPFEVSLFADVTVHFESSGQPSPVDVTRPLVFHGFANGVGQPRLARDAKAAEGVITLRRGAQVQLIDATDGIAAVELSVSGRLSLRTDLPCDALALDSRTPPERSPPHDVPGNGKVAWPRHALLHVASDPGRAPAVSIDIDRASGVPLWLEKQSGELVFVRADLGDVVVEGWVPARELTFDDSSRNGVVTSEWVRNTPIRCHASPEPKPKLHDARIAAGTPIYPAPGRHPWAKTTTELVIQIPEVSGAWVNPPFEWGGHGWIQRSAILRP